MLLFTFNSMNWIFKRQDWIKAPGPVFEGCLYSLMPNRRGVEINGGVGKLP